MELRGHGLVAALSCTRVVEKEFARRVWFRIKNTQLLTHTLTHTRAEKEKGSIKRRRRLPTPNAAAQETTPWRGGLRERRTAATRCGAGRSPGVASVRRLRRL